MVTFLVVVISQRRVNRTLFRHFCGKDEIRLSVTIGWLTEKRIGKDRPGHKFTYLWYIIEDRVKRVKPTHSLPEKNNNTNFDIASGTVAPVYLCYG